MNDFSNLLKKELNRQMTQTWNGANAYATSGSKLLDFNFATTALRNSSDAKIEKYFTGAFFENPLLAIKYLFWLRDCRGGNGERRVFRVCLKWLADNTREIVPAVINLIPEYGRMDDICTLFDTEYKADAVKMFRDQFAKDFVSMRVGEPVTLAGKWAPSENTSSKETRRLGGILRKELGMTPRNYRKTLSAFRDYTDVVERKLSAKKCDEIDYSKVPSQANVKYANAFMRNDEERRTAYLESLKKGETKINAATLQPHEIVAKYIGDDYGWNLSVTPYDETLEQLWKNLPDKTAGNTLVVMDSSGSMMAVYKSKIRPIDVAGGLAVYSADHNGSVWKGKFISFSENPRFMDMSNCKTLRDKLVLTYSNAECSNTDIEKTMLLILKTAVANHCKQEDMPQNILILSDCQFDSMVYINGEPKVLFENIADEYKAHGYELPRIIFWNLSGSVDNTIPMQQNPLGVVLMSGFSIQLLDMVMSGKTDPYEALLDVINGERYKPVEDAVKAVLEKG